MSPAIPAHRSRKNLDHKIVNILLSISSNKLFLVSLRRFFWAPSTNVWLRDKKDFNCAFYLEACGLFNLYIFSLTASSISIRLWIKGLRQGGSYSRGSFRGHKDSGGIWRTEQRMWKVSVSAVSTNPPPACSISIRLWIKGLSQGGSYSRGSFRGHKDSGGIWRTEQRMWKVSVSAVSPHPPPPPSSL